LNFRKITALLAASVAAIGFTVSAVQAAPIKTDIIMIVDESGSMGTVQTNLRNNIGLFASILDSFGIDARYGLVGYGSNTIVPRMLTDLTDANSFATAALGLRVNGGTEPGYVASAYALNALDGQTTLFSFRPDAIKNLIIFTDEPSNGDSGRGRIGGVNITSNPAGRGLVDDVIKANNALYNAVLSGTSTINSFGPLATENGGAVFTLGSLNTTNQQAVRDFVTAFAEAKAQETLDFCVRFPNDPACQNQVSSPGTLALAGLALLALVGQRRRFAA
jgi:uncharacterized protein (TIGR03382 family)